VSQVHAFVDYYVQKALNTELGEKTPNLSKRGNNGKEKYVFLEALSQTTRDPVELRDQLLNILLAGRDTTASLLSSLFLVLSRNPHIFSELRRQVLDDFGPYESPREITFARLKSCTYLQWVLNETLRLYAVVPINRRAAAADTTLPIGGGPDGKSPIFVPKGKEIFYAVHAMHKWKDLWGADAEEFRPERWVNRKHSWEYLPFNGGPRICIGQQFALTEAGHVVVRLLQRFDAVEGLEPAAGSGYRMTLTCAPAYGVKLRLREARE
jgi:cytochrome P450